MNENIKTPFIKIHNLLRQGRLSTALNLLLDFETNQIKPPFQIDRNDAWYSVGDIFFRQEKFGEAIKAFRKSIRTRPGDVQALIAIGNCYDELKKPKFAERYFRRALEQSLQEKASTHTILFNLANALFDQGRMKEAAQLYQKLKKAPLELRRKAKKNFLLATEK